MDAWDFDYYSNLRDVTKMSEEAGEECLSALAHFFRANYFYQLTLDFWKYSYTDALKAKQMRITSRHNDSQGSCVGWHFEEELEEADKMLEGSDEIISGDIYLWQLG